MYDEHPIDNFRPFSADCFKTVGRFHCPIPGVLLPTVDHYDTWPFSVWIDTGHHKQLAYIMIFAVFKRR
jgi:hypothetical protein